MNVESDRLNVDTGELYHRADLSAGNDLKNLAGGGQSRVDHMIKTN